ncbi:MAG: hypothetical protein NZ516_07030 [Raineya sp.]|nr:hypothetical protein [Raineya sp.]
MNRQTFFTFVSFCVGIIFFTACQKRLITSKNLSTQEAIAVLENGNFVLKKGEFLDKLVKDVLTRVEKSYQIADSKANYTLQLQDMNIAFDENTRVYYLHIVSQRNDNAFVTIAVALERNGDFLKVLD